MRGYLARLRFARGAAVAAGAVSRAACARRARRRCLRSEGGAGHAPGLCHHRPCRCRRHEQGGPDRPRQSIAPAHLLRAAGSDGRRHRERTISASSRCSTGRWIRARKICRPQALSKIADYMRNGGTILFDTRDLTLGRGAGRVLARRADLAPPAGQARPAAAGAGARRSCADQGVLHPAGLSRPLGRRQSLGRSAAARRSERRTRTGARRRRRLAGDHRRQ